MPLTNIIYLDAERRIGCWEITESSEELSESLTVDDELKERIKNCHERRVKELFATRVLLKRLMGNSEETIVYDENRKPSLKYGSEKISISHSKDRVVILISQSVEVGIDVEYVGEKILRIKEKFLRDRELEFAGEDLVKGTIYWCAKESLYKFYGERGLDFRKNLILNDFEVQRKGRFQAKIVKEHFYKSMSINYFVFDKFVMTFCCGN